MADRAAQAAAASARKDVETGGGRPGDENGKDTAMLLADGSSKSDGGDGGGGSCCDCTPPPGSCRAAIGDVMTGEFIGNISTLLVVANMVLMCCPYYGMSAEYEARLEDYSSVITWLFIVEMFMKLIGIGCASYWADS